MSRKWLFGGIVVVAAIAFGLWKWRGTGKQEAPMPSRGGSASAKMSPSVVRGTPRPDPKTLARGSIAGTVTTEAKTPIAGAQVCAFGSSSQLAEDTFRDPSCTTTDAQGRYSLGSLLPARYQLSASAKTFQPADYKSDPRRRDSLLALALGEAKTGIDFTLRGGGVEITGTVSDLTGGPVPDARVVASAGWRGQPGTIVVDADASGRYRAWVAPGHVEATAHADGYADGDGSGRAPGTIDILLTPESTLSGIVVDAVTGAPVEGARVTVGDADFGGGRDLFSDANGEFRASKLEPGRNVVTARAASGYGRSDGSILVGLGQHVTGVVVKLHAAVRVSGKLVVAGTGQPCTTGAFVSLRDQATERYVNLVAEPDGTLWGEGVLPGTYRVRASCEDFRPRDTYEPVVVANANVENLVWEVDAGSTIRGRVLAKSHGLAAREQIEGASVWARTVGKGSRERDDYGHTVSLADGSYELRGIGPGTYKVEVTTDRGQGPRDGYEVVVPPTGDVTKDLLVDEGGSITGSVVDGEGKPVAGITVSAAGATESWNSGDGKTDASGAFAIENLRPGLYRVTANRGWWASRMRKPGTTDDAKQGERVTVRAGAPATVKLVVETQSGTIRGTVVDSAGKPISDAFVNAARESDAAGAARGSTVLQSRWTAFDKPTLTGVDGTFTLENLGPGNYTVRAQRRGGGEAVTEHVPVGGETKVQIKDVGAIEGTVVGATPEDLTIALRDPATGYRRREQFFRSGGKFALADLPKGKFTITASTEAGQGQLEIELADGETRRGVAITLAKPLVLVGRVVELGTQTPVPGVVMSAWPVRGGRGSFTTNDDRAHITDEQGRFRIERVPPGLLQLRGSPKDFDTSPYHPVNAIKTATGGGEVDIGDIPIAKRRVKRGDPIGELGINFAEMPPDTLPDQREHRISWIDPAGPAAKTELKVGDVLQTIDGVDVRGVNAGLATSLLLAPPGTKLVFGLTRGATITLVLGAP